jgi:hypothetical protein
LLAVIGAASVDNQGIQTIQSFVPLHISLSIDL